MGAASFGEYLVNQGTITPAQLEKCLRIQNKQGLLQQIALELGYLRPDDIPAISAYMAGHPGIRFGEAAVSLGLITTGQLRYLLDVRTRRKVPIGDILRREGILTEEGLLAALMNFQGKRKKLGTILVVETSSTVRLFLQTTLSRYGYQAIQAESGAEALALMRERHPDLAIIAGVLKDMDGYELCRAVTSDPELASTQLAILSSDLRQQRIERAFEAGVTHFLAKPIQAKELINVIYQIEKELNEERAETVLVVDDSAGPRLVITRELGKAGYHTVQAVNGEEAIQKALEVRPDLITMDLEMPVMGGLEACQRLKQDPLTADIPVIIISSTCTPALVAKGFDAGVVEFFGKPFAPGQLAAYVNTLFEAKKIRKQEKILVAEDSPTTRHILSFLFSKNGYEVIAASDGEEASRLLAETLPDLVITDRDMPKKDGLALVAEMKQSPRFRHIPALMITSTHKREDLLRALSMGVNDYLVKPFDESELLLRVGVHLLTKRLYDEIAEQRAKQERINRRQGRLLHEITLLTQMGQAFQRCREAGELHAAIADSLAQLFPATVGVLRLLESNGAGTLAVAAWGEGIPDATGQSPIPARCPALATSAIHNAEDEDPANPCSCQPHWSTCIPLVVQGKKLGLLQLLRRRDDPADSENDGAWPLLATAAEHVALALDNQRLQESLRQQSIRDPLTGLFNRRHMEASLGREFARAQRLASPLGVIMLDVDHFKRFNDTYGHAAGDVVLKSLGTLLGEHTRQEDIACRFGGEEFVIIMPGANQDDAARRAEDLRRQVAEEVRLEFGGKPLPPFTISLGVAAWPESQGPPQALLAAADSALYAAKNSGRNRVATAASDIPSTAPPAD
ncbi:MAG: response regulator [Thermodesulfobacteriota bacterium]